MAKALTARAVEQAQPSVARREIPDAALPSFYLVVQPSGAKSWAVRYRTSGKPRKHTVGSYPALNLADARRAARDALRAVAEGRDPAADRRASRQGGGDRHVFANVVADFLQRHVSKKRSAWLIERYFRVEILPAWRTRRIQDITKRDVVQLLDGIVDRGRGVTANRVFSAIRKLFNWAIERDILSASPCAGMQPPASETTRERVLADHEVRWLWAACDRVGWPFGPLAKLLLVTGQRKGEVGKMTYGELALAAQPPVWTIPSNRTKNAREHAVPLSDLAVQVIGEVKRVAGKAGFVFTTNGKTPVSGFSRAQHILTREMSAIARAEASDPTLQIPHFTFHDLRRTAATGMQRLGMPIEVVEAVLNHKSGAIRGVAAIYARHDFADEKRRALDAWAGLLARILEGDEGGKVIAFPGAVG